MFPAAPVDVGGNVGHLLLNYILLALHADSKNPGIKDVLSSLTEVKNLGKLAFHLGIPRARIVDIITSESAEPLNEAIEYWFEITNPRPTWNKLVGALELCGECHIALSIQRKFLRVNLFTKLKIITVSTLYLYKLGCLLLHHVTSHCWNISGSGVAIGQDECIEKF